MTRRVVAISDFCDEVPPLPGALTEADFAAFWNSRPRAITPDNGAVRVVGGYLERLPLAAVAHGLADAAEVWSFVGSDKGPFESATALGRTVISLPAPRGLTRRRFRADAHGAPYGSADAIAHVRRHGAPDILCIWGLGVNEALLDACPGSVVIYNSIDAPAIRIPPEVSRHVDLFLTGAEWQSDEIRARHPGALCAVLPIGPEFASDETFHPTGAPKEFDVVYVAATQSYKRHDLLLDTLARRPGTRALCVVGYGELTDTLRAEAEARGLDITWVGPVDHDQVNALINRARVGLVCGVHDGAPAILTEYMLGGLPVLANAGLVCGRQYITPQTGLIAQEDDFAQALEVLLSRADTFDPRRVVQENWTWPRSILRLEALINDALNKRAEKTRKDIA
ncbi:glycosyltransferase [Paracoccus suum]|uniref:Glycosyltransferase n=1 Tax=Paracoccus suum TaxID=2259340 RepID=A0A344PLY1_9RHOB|nr:glycosyltransferase family 4 protein [Paracoccus suum]AXC50386.1 glycosyltransferase [Paracoccus suum]